MEKLDDKYFDHLGAPKPAAAFNALDFYRFDLFNRWLVSGSVLDVGAYLGDFIKLVKAYDPEREVIGTDINQARVDLCNEIVENDVVRMDFRNGSLRTFEDMSIDNIVCSEVIEHVPDDIFAIHELCRVAKKRIIITVPYKQKIEKHLCIHCAEYTPASGHLHTYQINSFDSKIPNGWKIFEKGTFGNVFTTIIAKKVNNKDIIRIFDTIFKKINPNKNRWMYVILDRL